MTFLKVLLILALVVFLLSRVRLGGVAEYRDEVFSLRLILGPVRVTLFPREKKKDTPKPEKKPVREKKSGGNEPSKEGGGEKTRRKLPPLGDLLMLALEAAGGLKRKIRIDELMVHLTWASPDPADTATGFGKANALMGMLWPLVDHNFHVKKRDLGVAVDFDRTSPAIDARGSLTMTVGQLVCFGVRFGIKFLLLWSRGGRAPENRQEVTKHERKEPSHQ